MIIEDISERLVFRPLVADRIWCAWWEPSGATLAEVEDALGAVIAAENFPFTLIARSGDRFVGTLTAIRSDIAARPDLGRCIAALWVEPEMLGQGVAPALVDAALWRFANVAWMSPTWRRDRLCISTMPVAAGHSASGTWATMTSMSPSGPCRC